MPKAKKRILFITPLAAYTGSEAVLWSILKTFDRNKFEAAVASYSPGPLMQKLPEDVRGFAVPGEFSMKDRVSFHLGIDPIKKALKQAHKQFEPDVWYLNTIAIPRAPEMARTLGIPLIAHFHELTLSYVYVGEADFSAVLHHSLAQIGCSQAVAEGIKRAGGKRVEVLHSFIDQIPTPNAERSLQLRKSLGIGPEDFMWIMSGSTSERKGFDYFPKIARLLQDPSIHLVWVGGRVSDGFVQAIENEMNSPELITHVHYLGVQREDYSNWLNAADGFLLTSREDSFPLVMLEAASLGKPIVALPSGGVVEFVKPGMGTVASVQSVDELVNAMTKIMKNPESYNSKTLALRASEFSTVNGIQRWHEIMERVLG